MDPYNELQKLPSGTYEQTYKLYSERFKLNNKSIEEIILSNSFPGRMNTTTGVYSTLFEDTKTVSTLYDKYYNIISEFIRNHKSIWLKEAIERKIKQIPENVKLYLKNLPRRIEIKYAGNEHVFKQHYGDIVMEFIDKLKGLSLKIEDLYSTTDSVIYAIYKAIEIAKYCCSYDFTHDKDYFEALLKDYTIKIYDQINDTNWNVPGLETLRASLLSKEHFLTRFHKDYTSYPLVVKEMKNPFNVWVLAYNEVLTTRKQNLLEIPKIDTYNRYIQSLKSKVYIELTKNGNLDKCVERYGSVECATLDLFKKLDHVSTKFYDPYQRDDFEYEQVNEVYSLCKMGACDFEPAEPLHFDVTPIEHINNIREPITHIHEQINIITVYDERVESASFDNRLLMCLVPSSEDVRFEDYEGVVYKSIDQYIYAKLFIDIIGSVDFSQPINRSTFQEKLSIIMKNLISENTIDVINRWLNIPSNINFLNTTRNKNIQFHTCASLNVNILDSIVGKYLMKARDSTTISVRNVKLIEWCQMRADDMLNMINACGKIKALVTKDAQLNALNSIYRYKTLNMNINIEPISQKYKALEYRHIWNYISGFISYALSLNFPEDQIAEMIEEGKNTLSFEKDPSDQDILDLIYIMKQVLQDYVYKFQNFESVARSQQFINLNTNVILSILLKTNFNNHLSDQAIITTIRENSINRVKYFMDVLSDKDVFNVLDQIPAQENLFDYDDDYYPSSPKAYDETDVEFDIEDVSEDGSRGGSPFYQRSPGISPVSSRGGSPYSIPPSPTYSVPSSPSIYSRLSPSY